MRPLGRFNFAAVEQVFFLLYTSSVMMTDEEELAPAVREILAAARGRDGGSHRIAVGARSLAAAIETTAATGRMPVIAEIKPTSPTTPEHRSEDPVDVAQAMVAGGATAISVLTEPEHFGGSVHALERVRSAVDVPVLRKDFVLEESQLDVVGADAVLLIVRFVDDLPGLFEAARDRGFEPLVEVHTEAELQQAVDVGAEIVGINNRDLSDLEVDLGTFERVATHAPDDLTLVAESGISDPLEVRRMRSAGADAILVGTALMDGDPKETTRRFVEV
jgi:indole-3-glycerol phosphate synthase